MKRRILLLVILIGCTTILYSQAIGSWKVYPALQNSTYNVATSDKVYSLCDGNLFSYNVNTTEVYVYDRLNGLHDTGIQFIRYDDSMQKLLVVYENGNVDLIYSDEDTYNMKQLKEKNYTNLIIREVVITDNIAYICTNSGFISLNMEKEEFENTFDLGLDVQSIAITGDMIYISTSSGFYTGDRTLNLLDRNNWTRVSSNAFNKLAMFKNELIGYNKNTGLFLINQQHFTTTALCSGSLSYFFCDENVMTTGNGTDTYIFYSTATLDNPQIIRQDNAFCHLSYRNGTYWASQNFQGLQPYTLSSEALTPTQSAIQPNSPVRDYFCNMHYNGNRLLVAGGDQNYNGINRDGTAMYYENGTWYNFSEEGIAEQIGQTYINTGSIAQDPNDPTHHYVGSVRRGLFEFKDLKFVANYNEQNSPLHGIPTLSNPGEYVRCDALQYDADGNLWMANSETDTVLTVLKTDGTWSKLYYEELDMAPHCTRIFFDEKGRLWLNSNRLTWDGIFVLDYNGTIDDTSDDTHLKRQTITNQDGITYNPDFYNCFEQDLDGAIWVGTSIGLFVIDDPENFVNNDDFVYTQIKIARDDGTDYADYLLNNVNITAIAIDAANRKWIGTASNGIYLFSADGQETLQHFTTENSPLISDNIQSIAINPETGEVMIGTYLGLMSYMSDATPPEQELDKNNVHVYPNPVRPDYNGIIAISGLTLNAEVKITTITGQLVCSGRANGGLFTWDGRNQKGKRVASGVYNIISTNAEGKKAIVNRITVIH